MADPRPLLLLTRPRPSSDAFWQELPEDLRDAVDFLINPLISIQVTGPLPDVQGAAGLIFTSANALDAYAALDGPIVDVPVIAVGEATGKAARALGFSPDVAGGTAEHVVAFILNKGFCGPLLHLRGENTIGNIATRLTAAGVETLDFVLYDQVLETFTPETREALSQDRPVIAPIFSPRTARQFCRESEGGSNISFAVISQAVADVLPQDARKRVRIATEPSRKAMKELVSDMIANAASLERRH